MENPKYVDSSCRDTDDQKAACQDFCVRIHKSLLAQLPPEIRLTVSWSRARKRSKCSSLEPRFKVALVWGMSALPALLVRTLVPWPTPFLNCQARHNPQRCGKDHELMDEARKTRYIAPLDGARWQGRRADHQEGWLMFLFTSRLCFTSTGTGMPPMPSGLNDSSAHGLEQFHS